MTRTMSISTTLLLLFLAAASATEFCFYRNAYRDGRINRFDCSIPSGSKFKIIWKLLPPLGRRSLGDSNTDHDHRGLRSLEDNDSHDQRGRRLSHQELSFTIAFENNAGGSLSKTWSSSDLDGIGRMEEHDIGSPHDGLMYFVIQCDDDDGPLCDNGFIVSFVIVECGCADDEFEVEGTPCRVFQSPGGLVQGADVGCWPRPDPPTPGSAPSPTPCFSGEVEKHLELFSTADGGGVTLPFVHQATVGHMFFSPLRLVCIGVSSKVSICHHRDAQGLITYASVALELVEIARKHHAMVQMLVYGLLFVVTGVCWCVELILGPRLGVLFMLVLGLYKYNKRAANPKKG
ncbi:expressed unknown protein [Seminavis robusta]|uniref:Uncharacterized protein n=1 Tax=Seminavis robusta TaxID=568900 RepID=A0A9N8EG60_9STRA|nr:expressed unknown protein [Seminavis robusta]|eukprot:Sro951_g223890.1 n/a (346) ;mRNA; r:20058-21569